MTDHADVSEQLSKFLSYVLRHRPMTLGLRLDRDGFVPMQTLLTKLRTTARWNWVTTKDLLRLIESSGKPRFEIVNGKIRAAYGHSIPFRITYPEVDPPASLFHGTTRKAAITIEQKGLEPGKRQYVHLSSTIEEAREVGARRDSSPVIFDVKAREARHAGTKFYKAGAVFLADTIPPQFLQRLR